MRVITTHLNPDFDAFASAVAAQKLFPDHTIVFGGELSPALKRFLSSRGLLLSFYNIRELDIENISSLIVVDTSDLQRLPAPIRRFVNRGIMTKFFDHHITRKPADQAGTYRELGACTTLMCNILRKKKKSISINEATLFAAAIYRETGNFTHLSTRAQDLRTAAWLLDIGARIDELGTYSSFRLSLSQQRLVENLILNMERLDVFGIEINIANTKRDSLPAGLSLVIERLWSFLGVENLVVLLKVKNRVYFSIKSRHMRLDVEQLNGNLRDSGAFTLGYLETGSLEEARREILKLFENNIERLIKVRDIMTSPVRTVLAEMRVEEVLKIMQRTGHHTLPVVDHEKLIGIARHRNVENAFRHNLGNKRILEIVDPMPVVVSSDDSVQAVTDKMIENNTTAVLVLENRILSGIVTRTDLLKSPFGRKGLLQSRTLNEDQNYVRLPISKMIEERIENRIVTMLRFLGAVGSELGMATYIVGGFVRDLLLNERNLDLDIVVEGNANTFAIAFKKYFNVKIVDHKEFLASSLFFNDGLRIDIATARTEYYKTPAVLPEVEMSTIKKDLYRRDFSINAMAIKLNQEEFGILIDFFGSRKDLAKGIIRSLHPLSFVEDPTRVLRAVRFEQRFGFEIEVRTAELLRSCVCEGYLARVTGQRLRDEFIKILQEPLPLKAIRRLKGLEIIDRLFIGTRLDRKTDSMLENYFQRRERNSVYTGNDKIFHTVLMILLKDSQTEVVQWHIERFGLPKNFLTRLAEAVEAAGKIESERPDRPSGFHKLILSRRPELLNYVDSTLTGEMVDRFEDYLKRVEEVRLSINGDVLKTDFGLKEGPAMREVLEALYCARLDGLSREREEEFVRDYLKGRGSE